MDSSTLLSFAAFSISAAWCLLRTSSSSVASSSSSSAAAAAASSSRDPQDAADWIMSRTEMATSSSHGVSLGSTGNCLLQVLHQLSKEEILQIRKRHTSSTLSISYTSNPHPSSLSPSNTSSSDEGHSRSSSGSGGLLIVRGRGCYLFDEQHRAYLDTRNNVAHCGHAHPFIQAVLQQQIQTLNTNSRYVHPNLAVLAQSLAQLFVVPAEPHAQPPPPQQRLRRLLPPEIVFFCNSGSEANDWALRIAQTVTRSRNIVCVEHAYHGHTQACLDVSPYKWNKKQPNRHPRYDNDDEKERENEQKEKESLLRCRRVAVVPVPDPFHDRCLRRNWTSLSSHHCNENMDNNNSVDDEGEGDDDILDYGEYYSRFVQEAINSWRNYQDGGLTDGVIASISGTSECAAAARAAASQPPQSQSQPQPAVLAAMIVEAAMSVAGVIVPPPGYLASCAQKVRAAGGLMIVDEVQTGFGRFGSCMWAFQYNSHPPDHEEEDDEDVDQNDNDDDDDPLNNIDNDDQCNKNSEEKAEVKPPVKQQQPSLSFVPDIVTVGKPFGNGMPLAAVVTTREVAERFATIAKAESNNGEYFNTFAGNPVSTAAGLAMLHVLQHEQLPNNARVVGAYLQKQLKALMQRISQQQQQQQRDSSHPRQLSSQSSFHPGGVWIGDVRGAGLFVGIELVRNPVTLEPATEETSWVCSTMQSKYSILISVDGPFDNVIVMKPPMIFTKENVNYFVDCFEKVLTKDIHQAGSIIQTCVKTLT